MSVGQYVSRSECQYIIISLCQFVIRSVYMKLTSLEFQKLTKPNFSENSHFWEKVQTFLYHCFFCLLPKNLIYWCVLFTLKMVHMFSLWSCENYMSARILLLRLCPKMLSNKIAGFFGTKNLKRNPVSLCGTTVKIFEVIWSV